MTTYTCPMHPNVTSDKPGLCPECNMKLIDTNEKKEDMCKDGTCEHHEQAEEEEEHHHHDHDGKKSLSKMAASATLHCLAGCAIGEVAGLIIGTALGFSAVATVILAVALAFVFGFALSTLPLKKAGLGFFAALSIVFAADTLSIATMEIVDNAVMLAIPGAMAAGLVDPLFWISMPIALAIAYLAAYPVNRYLLTKGKGHALVMKYHHGHNH